MAYEFYDAYKTIATSPAIQHRQHLQQIVNNEFTNASDYYIVSKKDRTTGVLSDLGIRITMPYEIKDKFTIKDDYRTLLFQDGTTLIDMGDMYYFNDYWWMVIDIGRIESPTASCLVQRCNIQLNFTEQSPLYENIITIYGVSSKFTMGSLKTAQYIVLPDNQMEVAIPNDENGQKIKYTSYGGTRFLLGNPYLNWRTIAFDNISHVRPVWSDTVGTFTDTNGLIKLKLELSATNNDYDNFSLGVAFQEYY